MKKITFFLIAIILAGTLAYFTAYSIYTSKQDKTEAPMPAALQKAAPMMKNDSINGEKEYYLIRSEEDMLIIYKMPQMQIYDSVKLSSLQLHKNEQSKLSRGIIFYNLKEVFEFLENSMS